MKFTWRDTNDDRAATRIELVLVLVGLALLFLVAVPLLAGNNSRSELAVCMNNLRQIGLGSRLWANDHDDQYPWWVEEAKGGTRRNPKSGNAWYEINHLSNQLASPKILVCPSDPKKHTAERWNGGPGGLAHVTNRDNALSYIVGLHAVRDNPQSLLSGDRHFTYSMGVRSCSIGINNASVLTPGDPNVGWTNAIHGLRGNLLFNSGEVRTVPREEFNQALDARTEENAVHILPTS